MTKGASEHSTSAELLATISRQQEVIDKLMLEVSALRDTKLADQPSDATAETILVTSSPQKSTQGAVCDAPLVCFVSICVCMFVLD